MVEKKPSGAANRKRKKLELDQARRNEAARKQEPSARANLRKPPVGNPTEAIAYAADCALIALGEVQADTQLTAEQRWAWTEKLTKAIGMTHSKAVMQHRLQMLTESDEPEHDEELEPNPLLGGVTPTG